MRSTYSYCEVNTSFIQKNWSSLYFVALQINSFVRLAELIIDIRPLAINPSVIFLFLLLREAWLRFKLKRTFHWTLTACFPLTHETLRAIITATNKTPPPIAAPNHILYQTIRHHINIIDHNQSHAKIYIRVTCRTMYVLSGRKNSVVANLKVNWRPLWLARLTTTP